MVVLVIMRGLVATRVARNGVWRTDLTVLTAAFLPGCEQLLPVGAQGTCYASSNPSACGTSDRSFHSAQRYTMKSESFH